MVVRRSQSALQIAAAVAALTGCSGPIFVRKNIGSSHQGVDYAGEEGDRVLAAADGWVVGASRGSKSDCIVLGHTLDDHEPRAGSAYNYYTSYCNLRDVLLTTEKTRVRRGSVIGHLAERVSLGSRRRPSWSGPILSFGLVVIAPVSTENPLEYLVGCFRRDRRYETGIVLTHPHVCN
jgi:hypothetical protein